MKDIKNLLVPYELAVMAKEKGFDKTCFGLYENNEILHTNKKYVFENDEKNVLAPLFQQLVDWFREERGMVISSPDWYQDKWFVAIYDLKSPKKSMLRLFDTESNSGEGFDNYNDAINKALEEAFKLI